LIQRPPVFTNRCCIPVSDQLPTRVGGASRRQKFAEVVSNEAQPEPNLIGLEPMAAHSRHLDRMLAFLNPCSAVPRLL
jgi:hypothetical protein